MQLFSSEKCCLQMYYSAVYVAIIQCACVMGGRNVGIICLTSSGTTQLTCVGVWVCVMSVFIPHLKNTMHVHVYIPGNETNTVICCFHKMCICVCIQVHIHVHVCHAHVQCISMYVMQDQLYNRPHLITRSLGVKFNTH